jgi:6-phosphogluconolactonase (cycloisomerase 2 family)
MDMNSVKQAKRRLGLAGGVALAAAAVLAGPAAAANAATGAGTDSSRAGGAVFVQTDNTSGNAVVAYQRAADGALSQAGNYSTGGLGGQLAGSVVDHLASQNSLVLDQATNTLYAVNAGSNTVSVFAVRGDRLRLVQTVGSGGTYPVSIAVRGNLVYVLNGLDGGSVQGFLSLGGRLLPIAAWHRSLGLDPTATPQFTNTPGDIGFTGEGSQLVVTTKANGDDIDVFRIGRTGAPSAAPTVNPEPGAVPFAFTAQGPNRIALAEAGTDAVGTFTVNPDGTVTQIAAAATGQAATCWIAPAGDGLLFASNAGSGSLSGYQESPSGSLKALGDTATDAGTVDASATPDGRFLYAQTGAAGVIDEYAVGHGGALSEIGSVTVPGAAGGEGIVAS